jgi:outer membrane protein assembly factor BamD
VSRRVTGVGGRHGGLLLFVALVVAGCGASVLPAIHSEAERLSVARRLHDQHQCPAAIELLKSYIAANGGAADVDEAIYLLGDCYLEQKDWVAAAAEFERLLRDYPESDSSGAARFQLGESQFRQSRPPDFDQEYTLKALEEWQRYVLDYPGHWRNAAAQRRILEARTRLADKLVRTGVLYLQLKLPESARVYFRKVTTEYPDTVMAPRAELGLAMCDVQQGKRTEAIEQLKSIEARFAGQPEAQRAARERKRLERRS